MASIPCAAYQASHIHANLRRQTVAARQREARLVSQGSVEGITIPEAGQRSRHSSAESTESQPSSPRVPGMEFFSHVFNFRKSQKPLRPLSASDAAAKIEARSVSSDGLVRSEAQ